ncbi:MAG: 50S ribosome-binding GTPase, partial [Bacteroidaceae bacterium]|nr:50S ribosome-binding GTPase [Bacteroidaceae bacterium]
MMNLSDLKNNETAFVSTVGGSNAFHLRLEEMGFVPGQEVTRLYASPLGSPIVFSMLGQRVALRRGEAELISIVSEWNDATSVVPETSVKVVPRAFPERAESCHPSCCAGCAGCGHSNKGAREGRLSGKADVSVALVGNPNCGKTAFFNAASGGHERTGNYAGVTVGSVERHVVFEDTKLRIIDLPGTYSLRAFSPEEAFVSNELAKNDVDVIINVLDVNNLERNLLLTVQLRERGIPMVGVLNMYDEFRASGSSLDVEELEHRLSIPLVPAVAKHKEGIEETLREAISLARKYKSSSPAAGMQDVWPVTGQKKWPTDGTGAHAFIHELLGGIYELKEGRTLRITAWADRFLARTPLAYMLFFLLMGLIFYATFEIGAYPMEWMESGVDRLSVW